MKTTVTTHNPVRTDVTSAETAHLGTDSRRWAVAGIAAAVCSIGAGVCAAFVDAIYDPSRFGDEQAIVERLADRVPMMLGFHVLSTVSALLLVVFGVGLHRHLRAAAPDSVAPAVAAFGVLATSVVVVLGGALDTEFIFAFAESEMINPANGALYNHWIGTVPAVWTLTGLSGLAMFVLSRQGVVARWMGVTGLVLGSLSLVVSVAPLQYMAGLTGSVWLLATAIGLARR